MATITGLDKVRDGFVSVLKTTHISKASITAGLNVETFEPGAARPGYMAWFQQPRLGLAYPYGPDSNLVRIDEGLYELEDITSIPELRSANIVTAWNSVQSGMLDINRELRRIVGGERVQQAELGRRSGVTDFEIASGRNGNRDMLTAALAQNAVAAGYLKHTRVSAGSRSRVYYSIGPNEVPPDAENEAPDFSALFSERKCSQGESMVAQVLFDMGLEYIVEFTTPSLRDRKCLRFDFYVRTNDPEYPVLLIEVQGEQHYKWTRHFHKTEAEFVKLQEHDKMKKDWAKLNGFPLLIIDVFGANKATRERIVREINKALKNLSA